LDVVLCGPNFARRNLTEAALPTAREQPE
jgi:hypothetical protein